MYPTELNGFTHYNQSNAWCAAALSQQEIPLAWVVLTLMTMGVVAATAVRMMMPTSRSITSSVAPVRIPVDDVDASSAAAEVAVGAVIAALFANDRAEAAAAEVAVGAVIAALFADDRAEAAAEAAAEVAFGAVIAALFSDDRAEVAAAEVAGDEVVIAADFRAEVVPIEQEYAVAPPIHEEKTKSLYDWVLLHCTLSTRNIGILLLAGGLAVALTASFPPIVIVASVVAGVGALMATYSFFKHRAPLDNTNSSEPLNDRLAPG